MVLTVLRFTAGVGTAHAVKTSPRRKEEEKWDNGNVHRAAAKIIVSKSRAARGSVCNVLLSRVVNSLDEQSDFLISILGNDAPVWGNLNFIPNIEVSSFLIVRGEDKSSISPRG